MSCCGQKRQAFRSSDSVAQRIRNEEEGDASTAYLESDHPRAAAIFRYTGSSYLRAEGILRQRVYEFSARTPELVIMPEDVAVMRAYPELVELKDRLSDGTSSVRAEGILKRRREKEPISR